MWCIKSGIIQTIIVAKKKVIENAMYNCNPKLAGTVVLDNYPQIHFLFLSCWVVPFPFPRSHSRDGLIVFSSLKLAISVFRIHKVIVSGENLCLKIFLALVRHRERSRALLRILLYEFSLKVVGKKQRARNCGWFCWLLCAVTRLDSLKFTSVIE